MNDSNIFSQETTIINDSKYIAKESGCLLEWATLHTGFFIKQNIMILFFGILQMIKQSFLSGLKQLYWKYFQKESVDINVQTKIVAPEFATGNKEKTHFNGNLHLHLFKIIDLEIHRFETHGKYKLICGAISVIVGITCIILPGLFHSIDNIISPTYWTN